MEQVPGSIRVMISYYWEYLRNGQPIPYPEWEPPCLSRREPKASSACICLSHWRGAGKKFDLFLWAGKAGSPPLSLDGNRISEGGLFASHICQQAVSETSGKSARKSEATLTSDKAQLRSRHHGSSALITVVTTRLVSMTTTLS